MGDNSPFRGRARVKAALGRVLRPAWPAVEALARASAGLGHRGLRVSWSRRWTSALDDALETLPPLDGCPHRLYRELLHETSVPKRHALVSERGEVLAVISLRRRRRHWEPVAYQCVPYAIAPARSPADLNRALPALGVEIVVDAGVQDEGFALTAMQSWTYDWYRIDLRGDFEAHWRKRKRQHRINHARRHVAQSEVRIDGAGDLAWIVEQWRTQWRNDPSQEIVAAEDRLNLWSAMQEASDPAGFQLHTLMLTREGRRTGGLVFTTRDGVVMPQCGGRDPQFDDGNIAAATTIALIDWARSNAFDSIDMAGGDYKRDWGPVGGQRRGIACRPGLVRALGRLM